MSICAAIGVSILYVPQPLLAAIASDLRIPLGQAALIATASQVGSAIGIVLFVPLAERFQPRTLIVAHAAALVVLLGFVVLIPAFVGVLVAYLLVGIAGSIPHFVVPAAAKMTSEARRSETTTVLVGAILCGIFGGRLVAGALVDALGWRGVLVVFVALAALVVPLALLSVDRGLTLSSQAVSYPALLRRTVRLFVSSRHLPLAGLMQCCVFGCFNAVWSVIAIHLTTTFGWSAAAAGAFAVVGLVAGIATPLSARLIDRLGSVRAAGVTLLSLLISAAAVALGSSSVVALAIAMFGVSWSNQATLASNQMRVLRAHVDAAAQANAGLMSLVFLGGALGAALGPLAFTVAGMAGTGVLAAAFATVAGLSWIVVNRRNVDGL